MVEAEDLREDSAKRGAIDVAAAHHADDFLAGELSAQLRRGRER
jgi:hypothetical protein